mmetsp:Transcript_98760/g.313424  ORF Transcript_98760/g.313424 Transcript_98760/m.313424 type:complete len:262 (-) Transcript_98760:112-897(-)
MEPNCSNSLLHIPCVQPFQHERTHLLGQVIQPILLGYLEQGGWPLQAGWQAARVHILKHGLDDLRHVVVHLQRRLVGLPHAALPHPLEDGAGRRQDGAVHGHPPTAADDLGVGELSLPPDAGVQVPRRGLPLPVDSDVHGTANTAAKENEWPVITHRHRDVVGERRVKGEGHVAVDVLHRQARLHHPQLHAQVVAIGVDVATGANLDRAIAGQLTRYLAEAGSLGSGFRQHGKREPNGEARPARIASVLHGDLEAGRLVNV